MAKYEKQTSYLHRCLPNATARLLFQWAGYRRLLRKVECQKVDEKIEISVRMSAAQIQMQYPPAPDDKHRAEETPFLTSFQHLNDCAGMWVSKQVKN